MVIALMLVTTDYAVSFKHFNCDLGKVDALKKIQLIYADGRGVEIICSNTRLKALLQSHTSRC